MPQTTSTTSPITPRSSPVVLAKLDQRTREARLMRETRADLVRHVGGNPSVTQKLLIDQACQLTLRLALMDRKLAEAGDQSEHDIRTYTTWCNALTRTLVRIGLKGAPERVPTLKDYLASRAADAAA